MIAAHCQGHKMIKIKEYENEDINKWVINAIGKSKSGGKFKRDVTVQTFTACQDQSKNLVETCPFDKLSATADSQEPTEEIVYGKSSVHLATTVSSARVDTSSTHPRAAILYATTNLK